VHVLTLTATPIPRTLQLALTGVREMSLIATPPVDRLAVRTFVCPTIPVVCARRSCASASAAARPSTSARASRTWTSCRRCANWCRRCKVAMAHGRWRRPELEEVMTDFYDGKYDILLSTNIVESGLDMPTVNTMVIHRADMFGLAQLYQLRGRIGRGKLRGYAYLTCRRAQGQRGGAEAAGGDADARQLGAGFTLASHDLDIRGAGNLLGEEQSGHIREVGIELYQQMLEEAVADGARRWRPAKEARPRAGRRRSTSACRC
jgi:transcription-repair coupling factor (superfamily II helicase)